MKCDFKMKRMFRSKVTVSARPLVSNETEEDFYPPHADLSFYFTVVKSTESNDGYRDFVQVDPGASLADYDPTPPTCSLLCMDKCRPGDCQGWTARVKESPVNLLKMPLSFHWE